jgi:hypothetical protein
MKKLILMGLIVLSACSSVPKGFDESRLKEEAQVVVKHLEALDVEWTIDKMRDDLESLLNEEDLLKILENKYETVGSGESDLTFTLSDVKDPKTSEVYALVIVQRDYTKGKGTYTLSFDQDYDLVGLYIK